MRTPPPSGPGCWGAGPGWRRSTGIPSRWIRRFFQLTEGQTRPGLAALQEKQLRAFLKQMKSHPGMALVLYGEALAAGKTEEAARRRRALDKMLAAWPYAGRRRVGPGAAARTEERLCKSVTEPGTEMCHTESV